MELEDALSIYEKPVDDISYVLGVDVGHGIGKDYSVIQILKIINYKPIQFKQVACYRDNTIDSYSFAEVVNRMSIYYNHAYIMCECNDEGAVVTNQLWYEYENINLINHGKHSKGEFGIRATKKTKPEACIFMKKLIEDGQVELCDRDTIEELSTFIERRGKFFGTNKHDDTVTALMWSIYFAKLDLLDEDISLFNKKDKEVEEEVWGILSDSTPSADEDFNWLKEGIFTD